MKTLAARGKGILAFEPVLGGAALQRCGSGRHSSKRALAPEGVTFSRRILRSFLPLAILAAFALLTGCGGSNGTTPVGVPIQISLSASSTNINQGQTSTITATVTGDTTNAGVTWSQSGPTGGSLTNATTTSVTYNAPSTLSGTAVASITATSKADTSVTNSVQITVVGVGISVTANPTTLGAGQASNLSATVTNLSSPNVTWSLSPNFGTLGSETGTTAVYTAPTTVTTSTTVTITATSTVNKSVSGTATITVNPAGTANNVAQLVVNGGPLLSTYPYPNGVFTSVTICEPGSTTSCATVDYILVDTGSFGLRVLQSALTGVNLTPITSGGLTLNDCVNFGDNSFLWGEVAPADVSISGEKASSVPIHLIADPAGDPTQVPPNCSNGGPDDDTQAGLLANGILGIGPEPTDCVFAGTNLCTGGGTYSFGYPYYLCSGNPLTCQSTEPAVPTSDQVTNPIVMFPTDNNGSSITFPSVPSSGESTATGTLTFGIGTQSNNGLGNATVYTPNQVSADLGWAITTDYSQLGLYLPFSFIDSGSSLFYIPNPNGTLIADCPSPNDLFFCPASNLVNQSATNTGANNASGTVNFEIDNADTLFATGDLAFATLAGWSSTATDCTTGTTDGNCAFDWGMPFFYGRTVFTSIDCPSGFTCTALPSGQPAAPWWAY